MKAAPQLTPAPFTHAGLRALLAPTSGPCVSLLMPTHRAFPDRGQDPIRYRNLLKQLAEQLATEVEPRTRDELLRPLRELDTPELWRQTQGGLAVYRSPGELACYRLPGALPEVAVVAERHHVKPLLPSLQSTQFFVLSLSQNEVALYHGTPEELSRLEAQTLPGSLREALGEERHVRHLDLHSVRKGSARVVHHGHGGANGAKSDELLRFLREVERGLWPLIRESSCPLVLVGVDYYHSLFRELSRYPVLDVGVVGNYEHASPDRLHELTWPLVRRQLRKQAAAAAATVRVALAAGRATTSLEEIGRAVAHTRVELLLVAEDTARWGRLDRESGALELHEERRPSSHDLTEELTQEALAGGARVIVLPRAEVPEGADLAAQLRW